MFGFLICDYTETAKDRSDVPLTRTADVPARQQALGTVDGNPTPIDDPSEGRP